MLLNSYFYFMERVSDNIEINKNTVCKNNWSKTLEKK